MERMISKEELLELELWIKWLQEMKDYNNYNKAA